MGRSIIEDSSIERSRDMWAVMEKYRARKNLSLEKTAQKAGISTSKMYGCKKRPWMLRLEDVFAICKVLQIPQREIAEAYLGKRIIQTED